ncbi:MAG: hypothetical protein ACO1OB_29645 [Archangium sp.]
MVKKVIAGIVALYVVGFIVVSGLVISATRAAEGRNARAIELGEKHARTPSEDDTPLGEACKGKLNVGSEKSVAVYLAKMKWAPSFSKDAYHVDETLVGTEDVFSVRLSDRHFKDGVVPSQLPGAIAKDNLNPVDWARHLKRASAGSPDMNDVKYLVVARYESLSPPSVGSDSYTGGTGEYGAKVLTFPEGEVVCEGRGHVRMKERVAASGRDADAAKLNAGNLVEFVFTQSVIMSPLQEVCSAGGSKLCELTLQSTSK